MRVTNWLKSQSLRAGIRTLCVQTSMFVLTIFGLLLVTFMIGRVVPVDPVLVIVGDRAPAEVYARVYAELGLDKPLYQQFLMYLYQVAQGDFGTSVLTSQNVAKDIAAFFPATIELAVTGTLVGVLLGVPLGVWSAVRKNSFLDQCVRVVALIGYSIPIF